MAVDAGCRLETQLGRWLEERPLQQGSFKVGGLTWQLASPLENQAEASLPFLT